MKKEFILIFGIFLLLSCNKNDDCEAIQPPETSIGIRILDSFGNSLIGENNIYKPSVITLTRGDKTFFIYFIENNEETYIKFYFDNIESGQDYQLKLNDQETDILNLNLKNNEGFCYDLLSVEALYVNGVEIQYDVNYAYIIQK